MENASKALIIAGTILIGVMLLTIMVQLFIAAGDFSKRYDDERAEQEKQKVNSQFEQYLGRHDLTIHDVITAYNLAKEYNEVNSDPIKVTANNVIDLNTHQPEIIKNTSTEISSGVEKLIVYKCSIKYYDESGKIKEVIFVKI